LPSYFPASPRVYPSPALLNGEFELLETPKTYGRCGAITHW